MEGQLDLNDMGKARHHIGSPGGKGGQFKSTSVPTEVRLPHHMSIEYPVSNTPYTSSVSAVVEAREVWEQAKAAIQAHAEVKRKGDREDSRSHLHKELQLIADANTARKAYVAARFKAAGIPNDAEGVDLYKSEIDDTLDILASLHANIKAVENQEPPSTPTQLMSELRRIWEDKEEFRKTIMSIDNSTNNLDEVCEAWQQHIEKASDPTRTMLVMSNLIRSVQVASLHSEAKQTDEWHTARWNDDWHYFDEDQLAEVQLSADISLKTISEKYELPPDGRWSRFASSIYRGCYLPRAEIFKRERQREIV